MDFIESMKPYIQPNGLVRSQPDQGTNNGILYLTEYLMIRKRLGLVDQAPAHIYKDEYYNVMRSCMPKEIGLLARNPNGDGGNEGPDDYIGLAVGCWLTGNFIMASFVIDYGWKHNGVFNNDNPGKFAWGSLLIRQPQLIAAFYWAAKRQPILPLRLYTAALLALSGKPNDPDSWILAWLLGQMAQEKSWICRQAMKILKKRLFKAYPSGMWDIMADYFGNNHPFALYIPKF